jgi:hypothetical protein
MGRAMLLLVTGSFIIFGMISLGVFERQSEINGMNVDYVLTAQARNLANSGMERALNNLIANPNWRTTMNSPHQYIYGEDLVQIWVMDNSTVGTNVPPGFLHVRARGLVGGAEAVAIARLFVSGGLPPINAAMGIYTDNLEFNVTGSAFLISGHDTNPDGTVGPEASLPGIAENSTSAFDEINSSTNDTQKSRLQGSGGSPSLTMSPDMDGDILQDFVDLAIANADEIYDAHVASGAGSLGTVADPKIIIVEGVLEVQNATGAGIIIIKEGGSLDARGNLDNFQGLIIIQGNADLTRGNIHIFGAMLFGGVNPSIEIDIDFRGNVTIQYSSSALDNLMGIGQINSSTKQRLLTIID